MKMGIKINRASMFCVIAIFFLFSCNKTNSNTGGQRTVKYEITGNFTGKLTVVYSDNANGNTVLTSVNLPWTKEITYTVNVAGIGIQAQADLTGVAGETATMKIYSAGKVVRTATATAGGLGELILPPLTIIF